MQNIVGPLITINQACDYIILKLTEGGVPLNNLKLQKLLYYAQAWQLAFTNGQQRLFRGQFQAWVHGPVNREIYDRFAAKSLYSDIRESDITKGFDPDDLPEEARSHIDEVLETYAKYSGSQLEGLTHREDPWTKAREGYRPSQRCEELIDEKVMARYYAKRLI